jgi:hypothetical protein
MICANPFRNARRVGIQKKGDINESGLSSAKGFKLKDLMGSVMDPTQECKEEAWGHIGAAWGSVAPGKAMGNESQAGKEEPESQ